MIEAATTVRMSRVRAISAFVFSGGLLIFLSPYLIHQAITKHLPWSVAMIAIPIYAVLSYGAFRVFWPHITRRGAATTQEKNNLNEK